MAIKAKLDERDSILFSANHDTVESNITLDELEDNLRKALEYDPGNAIYQQKLENIARERKMPAYNHHLQKGRDFLSDNRVQDAIQEFETALSHLPDGAEAMNELRLANQILQSKSAGKSNLIEEIWDKVKAGDRSDEAYLLEAQNQVKELVKEFPDDVELLVAATTFFIQENLALEDAYSMATRVEELVPGHRKNNKNLGDLFYNSNRYAEAMPHYEKALSLSESDRKAILLKLTQGYYTLGLRTKEEKFQQLAVKYATLGQQYNVDHPVVQRVLQRFGPGNES
jgi:tetratricopeptide (TPR) repeat protein